MTTLYLRQTFGRKYIIAEAMLIDWNLGKDFMSPHGYCSIRDVEEIKRMGYDEVCLKTRDGLSMVSFGI